MKLQRYFFDVIDEETKERLIPYNYGIVATSERLARKKFEAHIVTNESITVKLAKVEEVKPFNQKGIKQWN